MDTYLLLMILAIGIAVSIILTYFLTDRNAKKRTADYESIKKALPISKRELSDLTEEIEEARSMFQEIDSETKELQMLKQRGEEIVTDLERNTEILRRKESEIASLTDRDEVMRKELHDVTAKIDLYSRVDDFVEYGHFETPEYLYETSARFAEEIKRIRERQKTLIKDKNAVTYPTETTIAQDMTHNRRILVGQAKLMLVAFNIECDFLIGKVSPSNFARTVERIEKTANSIERSAATLHCGFNIEYVKLKFEECRLQYEYRLMKKEEKEEQRAIRDQIREEQKAIREYERAIAQAEREERMYSEMLVRAREELERASAVDRIIVEQKIADLERQLAEAEAKGERAKSMAEQTRKGHVYIISNIGSFGDDVFKIGLTRRLDPMDRVKELGGASVPFRFDVHAMIYVEDAPALEAALHREFAASRVNAVNRRKEFFRTDLPSIKAAVEKHGGENADFRMTILAEEYYESRRLQQAIASAA